MHIELLMGTGYWGNNFAFAGYYEWQNATGWTPNLDWFVRPGSTSRILERNLPG